MKIRDIISNDEYVFTEQDLNLEFRLLTTDAATAGKEDVLIIPNSLKIPNDLDIEPPLAIICEPRANIPKGFPTIRVTNPRLAMARAFYRYEKVNLEGVKLIGITGTNGKGGPAEFINRILCGEGYKVGVIGTGQIKIDGQIVSDKYYSMTTPDPPLLYKSLRLMKDAGCQVIIMEVSSHALALDKTEPLVFDYGVFTNLSPEHLDFHRDMEDYFAAKLKLFQNCECGVFNIDDEYGRRAFDLCLKKRISAGIIWQGDVGARNIENNGLNGISYTYDQNRFSIKMQLKTAGIYNIYNSMLAATVCIDMGCSPGEVKHRLEEIDALPGRFEIIKDGVLVILDYAHTDAAFKSVLRELSAIRGTKSLTVIFGCGGNRDKEKRPRMAKIAEKYADRIIVTSDNPRTEDTKQIIADIIQGFDGECYQIIENRNDAIRMGIIEAGDGDIVAVIGKGHEPYIIDNDGFHDYSEADIIRQALSERRSLR